MNGASCCGWRATGRQQLAEIAGLSRNTVGQLLAELASSEIVERHYGRLVIHRDRLRAALDNYIPLP